MSHFSRLWDPIIHLDHKYTHHIVFRDIGYVKGSYFGEVSLLLLREAKKSDSSHMSTDAEVMFSGDDGLGHVNGGNCEPFRAGHARQSGHF